ncbi:hypothetical protein VP01_1609g5 [Puccinia sorghi]|uniref:Uncharacterized protein n=1 Tax=Puccinia sorghi TaxID=27349 RepID=A0A0L6VH51_9BASI|nr:hypothetical protein VP01_1609g5 [Puccinia sorghi]
MVLNLSTPYPISIYICLYSPKHHLLIHVDMRNSTNESSTFLKSNTTTHFEIQISRKGNFKKGSKPFHTQPMKAQHFSNQTQPHIFFPQRNFQSLLSQLSLVTPSFSGKHDNKPFCLTPLSQPEQFLPLPLLSSLLSSCTLFSAYISSCTFLILFSFSSPFPCLLSSLNLSEATFDSIEFIRHTSSNLLLKLELVILETDLRYLTPHLQTSPWALWPTKSSLVLWFISILISYPPTQSTIKFPNKTDFLIQPKIDLTSLPTLSCFYSLFFFESPTNLTKPIGSLIHFLLSLSKKRDQSLLLPLSLAYLSHQVLASTVWVHMYVKDTDSSIMIGNVFILTCCSHVVVVAAADAACKLHYELIDPKMSVVSALPHAAFHKGSTHRLLFGPTTFGRMRQLKVSLKSHSSKRPTIRRLVNFEKETWLSFFSTLLPSKQPSNFRHLTNLPCHLLTLFTLITAISICFNPCLSRRVVIPASPHSNSNTLLFCVAGTLARENLRATNSLSTDPDFQARQKTKHPTQPGSTVISPGILPSPLLLEPIHELSVRGITYSYCDLDHFFVIIFLPPHLFQ